MKKYSFPFPPGIRIKIIPAPSHSRNSRYCIDFKVPCGTPVCAARDGIVVHRESRFGKGYPIKRYMKRANVVIIKHTNGEKIEHHHPNQKVTRSGKPIYAHNWKAIKGEKNRICPFAMEICQSSFRTKSETGTDNCLKRPDRVCNLSPSSFWGLPE